MLIHKGKEWEEKYAKDNKDVPNPDSTSNPEFKCVLQTILDSLKVDACMILFLCLKRILCS